MNDGTKAKLLMAGTLTNKALTWVILACALILAVALSSLLREATGRYSESMDALKELAEAGAVQPEIVGAFEGLMGITVSLFLLLTVVIILMRRRKQ